MPKLILAMLCLVTGASAQICVHSHGPDPTPQLGDNDHFRFLSLPASSVGIGQRSQLLVNRLLFANAPVLVTGLAVSPASIEQVTYGSLEIWMGYTNRDALSGRFADNPIGPMTKVLDVREHVRGCRLWSWTDVGLQQPFLYVPAAGNLLIEVVARRAAPGPAAALVVCSNIGGERLVQAEFTTTLPEAGAPYNTAPKIQVCAERASLDYFGLGCPGSGNTLPGAGLTGSAQIGQTATFWLSNAPPSTAAILVLGTSNAAPVYPIDLAPLGMPGCRLYLSPDLSLALGTDGLGIGRVPLAIPNQPTLVASNVYGQFFVVDPTGNARGLTASNYGRILIGL